jgi:hypothetical protein
MRFLDAIRKNNQTRIESSRMIAKTFYGDDKGGEYKSRYIRLWSDEFVRSGELMPLRQGKHQKRKSLLDDAAIKQACRGYLLSRRIELIDAVSFAQ